MSLRTGGSSFNAGTFAPKKYIKYTVSYASSIPTPANTIATYSYFGASGVLMATVEIEFDGSGRDVRGELI